MSMRRRTFPFDSVPIITFFIAYSPGLLSGHHTKARGQSLIQLQRCRIGIGGKKLLTVEPVPKLRDSIPPTSSHTEARCFQRGDSSMPSRIYSNGFRNDQSRPLSSEITLTPTSILWTRTRHIQQLTSLYITSAFVDSSPHSPPDTRRKIAVGMSPITSPYSNGPP